MNDFEKALEVAANERVKRSLDALRNYHGPSLEPFDRAIDDAFRAGSQWSRQFTVAEIVELLRSEDADSKLARGFGYASPKGVANFIEQHFKDRGGE